MIKFDVVLDDLPPTVVYYTNSHWGSFYSHNTNNYWWYKNFFTEQKMTKLAPEGREVVVIFEALNFDNKNLYYTDANGLEMQMRELNLTRYQMPNDYVKLPISLNDHSL